MATRGTAPALPISGMTSAVFPAGMFITPEGTFTNVGVNGIVANDPSIGTNGNALATNNTRLAFNNNTVNLAAATTFNVRDLRLAFQIQRWMERNAKSRNKIYRVFESSFWCIAY